MQVTKFPVTWALIAFGALIGIGVERYWLANRGPADHLAEGQTALEHAQKHLDPAYVCPMHPDVVSLEAGTCSICGMDLVQRKASLETDKPLTGLPEVTVSPAFMHNFGVRATEVTRGPVARRIEAIGRVARMPQPRVTDITPGLPGKLAALTDKKVGGAVSKGEQLFAVDAPEWRRLQELYLQSIEDADEARSAQLKQRLQSLGMTAARLAKLQHGGEVEQTLAVFAPINGTLVARSLLLGESVDAQSKVVTLGGINRIPVTVALFEGQGAWIKRGQPVTVRVPTLPGTEFRGQVDRGDSEINFSTRTLAVYIGFNTPDPRIRYGMLVDVTIEAAARQNVLRIPREALIRTGSGDRVIVARGNGRFQPVEVVTGLESGEVIEILSGLQEGQKVVVSGQFLIDSESSLRTSLQRLGGGEDAP
jgi:Cu(I)/Ag(I) efflux system membrane fusion protein